MKQLIFLVVASMLVASVGAFALLGAVQAAKTPQNWCFDAPSAGKSLCGYTSHKECNVGRDASLPVYPDLTKCYKS